MFTRSCLDLSANLLTGYVVTKCSITFGSVSSQKDCVLISAVKVHDSQACRCMEMTMEGISFTFDPRVNICCYLSKLASAL